MLYINLNTEPKKPLSTINTFTFMQNSQFNHLSSLESKYDEAGQIVFDIVEGNLKKHCVHPIYDKLLTGIDDLNNKEILDYGCGLGRNILSFHDRVKHITGVDICPRIIRLADEYIKKQTNCNNYRLVSNNGIDLSSIKDNSFDVVISSRCFSTIVVHDIRYNLLQEFCRILKPGGYLSLQMPFGGRKNSCQARYYMNHWGASGTHISVFVKHIKQIKLDLTTFLPFHQFSYEIVDSPPDEICEDVQWVFIKVKKCQ